MGINVHDRGSMAVHTSNVVMVSTVSIGFLRMIILTGNMSFRVSWRAHHGMSLDKVFARINREKVCYYIRDAHIVKNKWEPTVCFHGFVNFGQEEEGHHANIIPS
jgi:hypothetical protein